MEVAGGAFASRCEREPCHTTEPHPYPAVAHRRGPCPPHALPSTGADLSRTPPLPTKGARHQPPTDCFTGECPGALGAGACISIVGIASTNCAKRVSPDSKPRQTTKRRHSPEDPSRIATRGKISDCGRQVVSATSRTPTPPLPTTAVTLRPTPTCPEKVHPIVEDPLKRRQVANKVLMRGPSLLELKAAGW